MWLLPIIRLLAVTAATAQVTFAQCMFGAAFQKYTTFMFTPGFQSALGSLAGLRCTHPRGSHRPVGGTKSQSGEWTSSESAAFPSDLNAFLGGSLHSPWSRRRQRLQCHRQQRRQPAPADVMPAPAIEDTQRRQRSSPRRRTHHRPSHLRPPFRTVTSHRPSPHRSLRRTNAEMMEQGAYFQREGGRARTRSSAPDSSRGYSR